MQRRRIANLRFNRESRGKGVQPCTLTRRVLGSIPRLISAFIERYTMSGAAKHIYGQTVYQPVASGRGNREIYGQSASGGRT